MSENQTNQLIQHIKDLEYQHDNLVQKASLLKSMQDDTDAAIKSIKALGTRPESVVLVNLAEGVSVQGKISSASRIFVSIGSGVTVEKDAESAIKYLERKSGQLQAEIQNVLAKKHNLLASLEWEKMRVNQIIHAQGQRSGSGNV